MVLLSGIEPPTSPLPRECSTTELQQRREGGPMLSGASLVKPLAPNTVLWHRHFMEKAGNKSREERLAEALRANLRRRKAQNSDARASKPADSNSPKSTD